VGVSSVGLLKVREALRVGGPAIAAARTAAHAGSQGHVCEMSTAITIGISTADTIEGMRARSFADKAGPRVRIITVPITSEPVGPHFDAYVISQQWKDAPAPEHALPVPSRTK